MFGIARSLITLTFVMSLCSTALAGRALSGRVVDSHGNAVANAAVVICEKNMVGARFRNGTIDPQSVSGTHFTTTDAEGLYAFDDAPPGRCLLFAVDPDRGIVRRFAVADAQKLDLRLRSWATLTTRMLDASQRPVHGANVQVMQGRDDGFYVHFEDSTKTDIDGRAVFAHVPPGWICISRATPLWLRLAVAHLGEGENATLEIDHDASAVRGRVTIPKYDVPAERQFVSAFLSNDIDFPMLPDDARAMSSAEREAWYASEAGERFGDEQEASIAKMWGRSIEVNPDGTFTIENVPPGRYFLHTSAFRIDPQKQKRPRRPYDALPVPQSRADYLGADTMEISVPRPTNDPASREVRVEVASLASTKLLAVGESLPALSLPIFGSSPEQRLDLSTIKGRHVLIDVWATGCGPCVASLPKLKKFHDAHTNDARLQIVSLSGDNDFARLNRYLSSHDFGWTQCAIPDTRERQQVFQMFVETGIPTYLLIDPNGKLLLRTNDLDEATRAIHAALAGK